MFSTATRNMKSVVSYYIFVRFIWVRNYYTSCVKGCERRRDFKGRNLVNAVLLRCKLFCTSFKLGLVSISLPEGISLLELNDLILLSASCDRHDNSPDSSLSPDIESVFVCL